MGLMQNMTRRGRKGGRAVQMRKLKKQLYVSGIFDPTKVFPKEVPIPIDPQTVASPTSKISSILSLRISSSPKFRSKPTATETFYPKRIPIRPLRPIAPLSVLLLLNPHFLKL